MQRAPLRTLIDYDNLRLIDLTTIRAVGRFDPRPA